MLLPVEGTSVWGPRMKGQDRAYDRRGRDKVGVGHGRNRTGQAAERKRQG